MIRNGRLSAGSLGVCMLAIAIAAFCAGARAETSAQAPLETLLITDNPLFGVRIAASPLDVDGAGSDTTDFLLTYRQGTNVTLTAPSSANTGSGIVHFIRWNLNDVPQPTGKRKLAFTITRDSVAVAVYTTAQWNLVIESADVGGVTITGDQPGVTDYITLADDHAAISVVAPARFTDNLGRTWFFEHWIRNGHDQTNLVLTLNFVIARDTIIIAQYKRVTRIVISGPTSVFERSSHNYTAEAFFSDGPSHDVTHVADWAENSVFMHFITRGVLRADSVSRTVKVKFTVSFGGVSRTFAVTIQNR